MWTRYQIADSSLWPLVVNQSTYPQPFAFPGGGVSVTSSPMGAVFYPTNTGGGPPYNMFPLPFLYQGSGNILFTSPTYVVANGQHPWTCGR